MEVYHIHYSGADALQLPRQHWQHYAIIFRISRVYRSPVPPRRAQAEARVRRVDPNHVAILAPTPTPDSVQNRESGSGAGIANSGSLVFSGSAAFIGMVDVSESVNPSARTVVVK